MAKPEKEDRKEGRDQERALRAFVKRQPPETEKRLKKVLKERGLWRGDDKHEHAD